MPLPPWVTVREARVWPITQTAQCPAPRKRPVVVALLVTVLPTDVSYHLAVLENTVHVPPSPRLAHPLPEKSRRDCWTLSLPSSVSSWQPSAGTTPTGRTLCVHPSPPSRDAAWNTGTKETALLVPGCEMTQLLDDLVKSRPRLCEREVYHKSHQTLRKKFKNKIK